MVHPGELISRTGEALIGGNLEAMSRAYSYPFVVAMDDVQHVLRQPGEIVEVLAAFRNDLLGQGIVSADTRIESHVIFNDDMAFLNAHTVYFDAAGAEVTDSKTSYVMRLNHGRWEIITVSIDKKASHAPGACLLEARAA